MSAIIKKNFNLLIIFTVTMIASFSCMDPVFQDEQKILENTDVDFLDPDNDFPNGNFDDKLNDWGGYTDNAESFVSLDTSNEPSYSDMSIENVVKISARNGGSGIYNYFSYRPGDTLSFSFYYMIPDSIASQSNYLMFELGHSARSVDKKRNILEVNNSWYTPENEDSTKRLIVDGNWHKVKMEHVFTHQNTEGMYFRVGLWEGSQYQTGELSSESVVILLDNFHVNRKENNNSKPSDFNIIFPNSNSIFDLDTINNFQTIPFLWEPSFDEDTVLYTNRLVAKIPADNLLMSNGFEEYEEVTRVNPADNSVIDYKMPDGFGLGFLNWFVGQSDGDNYFTSWVTDTVSRTGDHSFRIGPAPVNKPKHSSLLMYTLSMVFSNETMNKDRIEPGSELILRGYMMTPSDDKLTGDNSASIMISTFTDEWYYHTSPSIKSNYEPDIWHPFEVSMIIPESSFSPNTSVALLCFRYDQYADGKGSVYFDDIVISISKPIRYKVTDYFDITTNQTSSTMSGAYLQNLFDYINYDLSGLTLSTIKFDWSILATDLSAHVQALNSPIIFTVLDSSPSESTSNIGNIDTDDHQIESLIINQLIGGN